MDTKLTIEEQRFQLEQQKHWDTNSLNNKKLDLERDKIANKQIEINNKHLEKMTEIEAKSRPSTKEHIDLISTVDLQKKENAAIELEATKERHEYELALKELEADSNQDKRTNEANNEAGKREQDIIIAKINRNRWITLYIASLIAFLSVIGLVGFIVHENNTLQIEERIIEVSR